MRWKILAATILIEAVHAGGAGGGSAGGADWRYFLAGGVSAATSHGITTPIDVVKTRMQAKPKKYTRGVMAAAKDIVEEEGAAFLLQGLAPTVIGEPRSFIHTANLADD